MAEDVIERVEQHIAKAEALGQNYGSIVHPADLRALIALARAAKAFLAEADAGCVSVETDKALRAALASGNEG